MLKVAVVYHYIAHYRIPVFSELAKSQEVDYTFFSGEETDQNIKIASKEEVKTAGLKWYALSNKWFINNRFLWQKGLISALFSKKFDAFIFLGNPYFFSTWCALFICKFLKIKSVIWTHGVTDELSGIKLLIFKLLWFLSDNIMLYGNYARKEMIKYGVSSEKLAVIYNSLDYEAQLAVRDSLVSTSLFESHFRNSDPVIIFIGRLTAVKRLDMLVEAHHILHKKGVACNVVIVGYGNQYERINNLVNKYNFSDRYWFYGSCYTEKEIGELIFNSVVCVSPGNVGLTALHSMMYGTPVISHSNKLNQMPECESIESGKTGDWFEEGNVEDLAGKIEIWISKHKNNTVDTKKNCYAVLDNLYNPFNQVKCINQVMFDL